MTGPESCDRPNAPARYGQPRSVWRPDASGGTTTAASSPRESPGRSIGASVFGWPGSTNSTRKSSLPFVRARRRARPSMTKGQLGCTRAIASGWNGSRSRRGAVSIRFAAAPRYRRSPGDSRAARLSIERRTARRRLRANRRPGIFWCALQALRAASVAQVTWRRCFLPARPGGSRRKSRSCPDRARAGARLCSLPASSRPRG